MTTVRFLRVVSGAAAVALAACGGGGGGGAGGTGGGGSGGGGGLCSDAPACVAALYNLGQSCPATGACTTQTTNNIIASCFANGVKVYVDYTHATIRQTKPDGVTTCVVETYAPNAVDPTTLDLTFKDASGATVATATSGSAGQIFDCDGQTYNPAVQCPSAGSSEPTCAPGTCQ